MGLDQDQRGYHQHIIFVSGSGIFQHVNGFDLVASLEVFLAQPSQILPGLRGV
jgi:hypothetical protein